MVEGGEDQGRAVFVDGTVATGRRPKPLSRRRLLVGGAAAVVVGAGATTWLLRDPARPPNVLEGRLPTGAFDSIEGISPFTTPMSDHFVIDIALERPVVNPDLYVLRVDGPLAPNPLTLTYEDLLARELTTRQVALVCVSNPVGGELVSNAVWTGVPLSSLLDEAGIDDPTKRDGQVFSTGTDGYSAGFRSSLAYDGRNRHGCVVHERPTAFPRSRIPGPPHRRR